MESVVETANSVRLKERKAAEVLAACIEAIEADDDRLRAFVHCDFDRAMADAVALDERIANGNDPGPLAGVPFGVKDLEDCSGMPTRQGSLIYRDAAAAAADSVHVARLRRSGAIPLGKTTATEFGLQLRTNTRLSGVTRNPWNDAYTTAGSSGGSACAVAAGFVPFCTASDGGGSTRTPAAFAGIVGMKPSQGRIPAAMPGDLGSLGAHTTTVGDTARYLDVVAGPDNRDHTSLPSSDVSYEAAIERLPTAGIRIAWSADLGCTPIDNEVRSICERAAIAIASAAGATIDDAACAVDDPLDAVGPLHFHRVLGSLERDGVLPDRVDELCEDTVAMLELALPMTRADVAHASRLRTILVRQVATIFSYCDVLLTPVTPVQPFEATGALPAMITERRPHAMRSAKAINGAIVSPLTAVFNATWNPAISVPAGRTSTGLPVGIQIVAPRHRDELALRFARILEQVQPWPRHAARLGA